MNKQDVSASDFAKAYVNRYHDKDYGNIVVNWTIKDGKHTVPSLNTMIERKFGVSKAERTAVIDGLLKDGFVTEASRHPHGGFSIVLAGWQAPKRKKRRSQSLNDNEIREVNRTFRNLIQV